MKKLMALALISIIGANVASANCDSAYLKRLQKIESKRIFGESQYGGIAIDQGAENALYVSGAAGAIGGMLVADHIVYGSATQ